MLASLAALDADLPPKVMRLEAPAPPPAPASSTAIMVTAPQAQPAAQAQPASRAQSSLPPLSQSIIALQTSLASTLPLEVRKPLPSDGTLIVVQSGQLECFLRHGGQLPCMELVLRCEHGMWIVIERIVKPGGTVLVLNVQPLAVVMATQPTPNQLDLEPSKFTLTPLFPAGTSQELTYTPRIVYDTTREEAYLHLTLQASA